MRRRAPRARPRTSLAAAYPKLARQWHPSRNGELHAADVVPGSNRRVWWKCPAGPQHEWQATVVSRTHRDTGCPYCRGLRASAQHSLATRFPKVAAQWHPTRNGKLTPADVTPHSAYRAWWRCPKAPDHVWAAVVASRARNGAGCPFCSQKRGRPSMAISLRSPRLAREWHPTRNGRRTPSDVSIDAVSSFWWKCPKGPDHEWKATVRHRAREGGGCPFCAGHRASRGLSLRTEHPDLARQWHPTKNGALTPRDVVPGSSRKVWWRCPKGPDHEWRATVWSRARGGRGCPVCRGRKVTLARSLSTSHPQLAAQWHPRRNGALRPTAVVAGTNRHVWWKCRKGPDHEWRATVNSRTGSRTGCPFCLGRRASVTNSLAVLAPRLAAQWHPTKNGKLRPTDVPAGSSRGVWWKCPQAPDHAWQAVVGIRFRSQGRCPFCLGRLVSRGNSLAARFPALAREWHPRKNGGLRPQDVYAGSHRAVWWRCPKGPDHEWRAPVRQRTEGGSGGGRCPFCAGRRVSRSNSLASLFPALAAQWNPTKNGRLRPQDVYARSHRAAWWRCPRGADHEWQASIRERVQQHGVRCPFCTGYRASATNSLRALFPKLAAEWHPTRNGELTPAGVVAATLRQAWWRCALGHVWRDAVRARTTRGRGCPLCSEGITSRARSE